MRALTSARRWRYRVACGLAAVAACVAAQGASPEAALHERHAALQADLAHNAFGRPLHLDSHSDSGNLRGEVFAVVEHPFAKLESAFTGADNWCDILILHLNVKQCRTAASGARVIVHIGTKHAQQVESATRVDFDFLVASRGAAYVRVALGAERGPMGTRDYRIALEAVPLDARRSFLHLSYSYGYGTMARIAMQGYLATIGRGKVGFSVVERTADGKPVYVGDVRGVVERNTMRYFLAIDAYLNSLDLPPKEQVPRRLHDWFAATEQYATQLHEIDEREYLEMKRVETGIATRMGGAPID